MDECAAQAPRRLNGVQAGNRQSRRALYGVVVWLFWAALSLYLPTLPTYIESKSSNLTAVGIVLSTYGLFRAITALPLGLAADRLGHRKPFIMLGLALTGLGAWVMGTADTATWLGIGRAITGLGGGTWVLLVVVFTSLFSPQEAIRATAGISLVSTAAAMCATAFTGSLNRLGGYSLAFFLAAGSATLALLTILPLREEHRPVQGTIEGNIGHLITSRGLLLPALFNGVLLYTDYATAAGFTPVLAKQLGASDIALSLLMSVYVGLAMVGNLAAMALAKRVHGSWLIRLSFALITAGLVGLATAPSVPLIFLAQFVIGFGGGLGYPVLMGMSTRQVAPSQHCTAIGLHQAVCGIGLFSGPWLSGVLADAMGIRLTFGMTAAVCLPIALFGGQWLYRQRQALGSD